MILKTRIGILLVAISMFTVVFNAMFFDYKFIYLIGTGVLAIAAVIILIDKKKLNGYKNFKELFLNEYDVFILLFAVILFGAKYLAPEPYEQMLHLFSLGTMLLVLAVGSKLRSRD
ncbi:hypothetical protein [Bacillus toyonensis]|uniref:hypothetical protein n=1 Tax=Bacillus toyonensis TaxID=155322 RepID=UPI002E1B2080|nr:hypothetical protein [Bacillus toyonensis]